MEVKETKNAIVNRGLLVNNSVFNSSLKTLLETKLTKTPRRQLIQLYNLTQEIGKELSDWINSCALSHHAKVAGGHYSFEKNEDKALYIDEVNEYLSELEELPIPKVKIELSEGVELTAAIELALESVVEFN